MSIKSELIKNVVGIIASVLSDNAVNIKTSMIDRFRFWHFRNQVQRNIKAFINKNDGTILTKGSYYAFLKYHHPIDKIYKYISEPHIQNKGEKDFLRGLSSVCKENIITSGDLVLVQDEHLILELFEIVYQSYKKFLSEQLNLKDAYMVTEAKQSKYAIEDLSNDMKQGCKGIESIINMLEEPDRIKDAAVIWDIYECLNKELWSGKLEEVRKLLPIVERKNQSLENALYIKIQLFTENNLNEEDIIKRWELIKDVNIQNDVARQLILVNIMNKAILECLLKNLKDGTLKQIVAILIEEKWEEIISIKSVGVREYKCRLTDLFNNEEWIVRRIAAVYLLYVEKQSIFNMVQVIEKLIGKNRNFIDKLLIINQKVESEARGFVGEMAKDNRRELEKHQEYLKENKQVYLLANAKIQEIFLITLFGIMLMLNQEGLLDYYDELPEDLRTNKHIQAFKVQSEIKEGTITEDQVIEFCLSSDHYWLLNNYLVQFSKEPERIIYVLDKCKIVLEKDLELFLLYVQVLKSTSGKDSVIDILDTYKNLYSQYLNYWIMYIGLSKDISIDEIFQKWLSEKLIGYGLNVELEFADILMQYEKYEEAEKVISKVEALKISTPILLRIKSKILLEGGFELDALKLLLNIFGKYQNDPYVVDTIIVISLNNRRKISPGVIAAAVKIGSARLLMLAANAYEIVNDHVNAVLMITRALLKADTQDVDIYGRYFGIHLSQNTDEVRKISCVDSDTAVYLKNINDNSEKIYCIYSKDVLPSEPYVWENAIHIYKDTAIGMSLFRKRTEDGIDINGQQYQIKEIMPVDCYLIRTCLRNMCEGGVVQQYSIPKDSQEKLVYDDFSRWLKKNIPESEKEHQWLDNYKNLNNIPFPFYRLQSYTSLSYSQLIMALMEERSINIRELLNMQEKKGDSFVLSFAAAVMLYKIGVDMRYLLNRDIVISESTLNEVVAEEDAIHRTNNKETVATMGVIDDQVFMHRANEAEKLKLIQSATGLKVYVQQLPNIRNESDIRIDKLKTLDMKDTFGICDYDALVIAENEKRLFVSGEIFSSSLGQIESSQLAIVSLVDFMGLIKIPVEELLDYIIEMVNYQFVVFLTSQIVKYLMQEVKLITDDDAREKVLGKWIDCLALGDGMDAEYKGIFIQGLTDIFKRMYDQYNDNNNEVWIILVNFVVRYNNIKVEIQKSRVLENDN